MQGSFGINKLQHGSVAAGAFRISSCRTVSINVNMLHFFYPKTFPLLCFSMFL